MEEEIFLENVDLLERLIAGHLSDEEVQDTYRRLKDDVQLAAMYEVLLKLPRAIRWNKLEGVLGKLRDLEKNNRDRLGFDMMKL
ncbi:MAG: hypothetical protein IPL46_01790 [Saprospiraceae bacterium]|nr:hypothetical protein [Saprospiraceae bacterium]